MKAKEIKTYNDFINFINKCKINAISILLDDYRISICRWTESDKKQTIIGAGFGDSYKKLFNEESWRDKDIKIEINSIGIPVFLSDRQGVTLYSINYIKEIHSYNVNEILKKE